MVVVRPVGLGIEMLHEAENKEVRRGKKRMKESGIRNQESTKNQESPYLHQSSPAFDSSP